MQVGTRVNVVPSNPSAAGRGIGFIDYLANGVGSVLVMVKFPYQDRPIACFRADCIECDAYPAYEAQVYTDGVRAPKWNVRVSPRTTNWDGRGKLLAQRLPTWSALRHAEAAERFRINSGRAASIARVYWEFAFTRHMGRAPQFLDWRISGIGSDALPSHVKARLRSLSQACTGYADISRAHDRAASYRRRVKPITEAI